MGRGGPIGSGAKSWGRSLENEDWGLGRWTSISECMYLKHEYLSSNLQQNIRKPQMAVGAWNPGTEGQRQADQRVLWPLSLEETESFPSSEKPYPKATMGQWQEDTPCSGLHLQGPAHSPTHTHNTCTNVHTERVHTFLRKWIRYRRVHLLFFSLHTQLCTSTFLPQVNIAWGPYQKLRRCWPCVLGFLSL